MDINHPLEAIPQGWPTWTFFATWLVLFLSLGGLATPDLDAAGVADENKRIIALERPADAAGARGVIDEWRRAGRLGEVRRSIRFDNVLIIAYSTLEAFGCVIAARAFFAPGTTAYGVALLVAWLPWLAGLLDYAENFAMHRMLGGFEGEALPRIAWWCATVKFGIVLPLLVWVLAGLLWLALKHLFGLGR